MLNRALLTYLLLCACVFVLAGCPEKKTTPATGPQADVVRAASGEIGTAVAKITTETKAIVKEAPTTRPHTNAINDQTTKLLATERKLDESQGIIRDRDKDCAALLANNEKLDKKIRQLQDEHNTLVKWGLASLALLAVVGAAACVWTANVRMAGFCATLFALSISGEFLLEWARWVALGVAVCLVGGAIYLILVKHIHLKDIVANGTSGIAGLKPSTARVVNSIKSKLRGKS